MVDSAKVLAVFRKSPGVWIQPASVAYSMRLTAKSAAELRAETLPGLVRSGELDTRVGTGGRVEYMRPG